MRRAFYLKWSAYYNSKTSLAPFYQSRVAERLRFYGRNPKKEHWIDSTQHPAFSFNYRSWRFNYLISFCTMNQYGSPIVNSVLNTFLARSFFVMPSILQWGACNAQNWKKWQQILTLFPKKSFFNVFLSILYFLRGWGSVEEGAGFREQPIPGGCFAFPV